MSLSVYLCMFGSSVFSDLTKSTLKKFTRFSWALFRVQCSLPVAGLRHLFLTECLEVFLAFPRRRSWDRDSVLGTSYLRVHGNCNATKEDLFRWNRDHLNRPAWLSESCNFLTFRERTVEKESRRLVGEFSCFATFLSPEDQLRNSWEDARGSLAQTLLFHSPFRKVVADHRLL